MHAVVDSWKQGFFLSDEPKSEGAPSSTGVWTGVKAAPGHSGMVTFSSSIQMYGSSSFHNMSE